MEHWDLIKMNELTLYIVLLILGGHFISDFVYQTNDMAVNKSKNNWWLSYHAIVYGVILFCISNAFGLFDTWQLIMYWAVTNAAIHWCVDYCTSRVTSYLWKKGDVHYFFVVIGLDQFIHYTCLFWTYQNISY